MQENLLLYGLETQCVMKTNKKRKSRSNYSLASASEAQYKSGGQG